MTEIWKPVVGYENNYKVSSEGRFQNRSGRILSCQTMASGYAIITLSKNCIAKTFRAHSLVLAAFVGPRPIGMQTRHLNGCRTDNRLSNLVWGTGSENNADKVRHGTAYSYYSGKRFSDHPNGKLTEAQAYVLVRMTAWFLPKTLAAMAGVSTATVQRLRREHPEWVMQQASSRKERDMGRQSP